MGNDTRSKLKTNWYSRNNSNKGDKSTSREKDVEKGMTINHLQSILHNCKNETFEYMNRDKPNGHTSIRSPSSKQPKKKSTNKLNVVYKQLYDKIRVLQTIGEKLFEKSQRIKDYEHKRVAELDERERRLKEDEKRINIPDHEPNFKNSLKTEDLFDWSAKNEYNDIVHQLRSIDTRQNTNALEGFDQPEGNFPKTTRNIRSTTDLYRNDIVNIQNASQHLMLKSLEPNEFSPPRFNNMVSDYKEVVEVATNTQVVQSDKSTQNKISFSEFSTQVSIISQKDINDVEAMHRKIEIFNKEKQTFNNQRSKELKGIEVQKQELTEREEYIKREQHKLIDAHEKIEEEKAKLSDLQSKSRFSNTLFR